MNLIHKLKIKSDHYSGCNVTSLMTSIIHISVVHEVRCGFYSDLLKTYRVRGTKLIF